MTATKMTPTVVWFTGRSGSGKSTIAKIVNDCLRSYQFSTLLIDGDEMRKTVSFDLGYSYSDRLENTVRAARIARLVCSQLDVTIVSMISPNRLSRADIKHGFSLMGVRMLEVEVYAFVDTLQKRDPKGLYKKFTLTQMGCDDYQSSDKPDVYCDTENFSANECADKVLKAIP